MILVGNRRGSAVDLAAHLMNDLDNEHIQVHELRGFLANDLEGAFREAYAISKGTRCKKPFYSLILSPPETENVSVEAFEAAIAMIEQKLGFVGQPRAVVFHEKKGRRHAHCVWSRIDTEHMWAIDPYQDRLHLNEIGRELFLEHGWNMPPGLRRKEDADPLNYSHAQHQQAKRVGFDPTELKRLFAECWQRSDSKASFSQALKEHGFILARGDRRGHVAVDAHGEIYAIARWVGAKTKEVRARLGPPEDLPSVEDALLYWERCGPDTGNETEANPDDDPAFRHRLEELKRTLQAIIEDQRKARTELQQAHELRRAKETKGRAVLIPTGVRAAWLKLSGRYQAIQRDIELQASKCDARDRAEYQSLIESQLQRRRELQAEIVRLDHDLQDAETDKVARRLKSDPAQRLILPLDPEVLSNKAKVRRDPTYILKIITDKKETFSRPDVARGLAEYIDDAGTLTAAVDRVMRAPALVEVDREPLPRYSTWEMLELKQALAERVQHLSQANGAIVSSSKVCAAIARQNTALKRSAGAALSREQEVAIRHCLGPHRLSSVIGLAGAGKSTMLAGIKDACTRQGLHVAGAALSGKAADGLESASGIESRTLASLERSWKMGYSRLTRNDVLVIDEAGMIGTRQLNRFVEEVQKSGAKLILVGDPEQLQPINAGTPFKEIAEQTGVTHLTEIHRQQQDWQKQASLDLAQSRIGKALDAYEAHDRVKQSANTSDAIADLVDDYMADFAENETQSSRLALAYRRKDVFAINQAIRAARQSAGELENGRHVQTDHGPRVFAPGDRILFTKNDHTLGLRNGMIGTAKSVASNQLTIQLDDTGKTLTLNPHHFAALDHGYATTIHKSQGATVDNTFILASAQMDRHLAYVAMTRHKQDTSLYGDNTALQKLRRSGMVEEAVPHSQNQRRKPPGPSMM